MASEGAWFYVVIDWENKHILLRAEELGRIFTHVLMPSEARMLAEDLVRMADRVAPPQILCGEDKRGK